MKEVRKGESEGPCLVCGEVVSTVTHYTRPRVGASFWACCHHSGEEIDRALSGQGAFGNAVPETPGESDGWCAAAARQERLDSDLHARITRAIEEAELRFFRSICESFPEAKFGDLAPEEDLDFHRAAKTVVARWVQWNVIPPEEEETS